MGKATLVLCLVLVIQLPAFAQIDYTKQYASAKTLLREGKYNLAMEMFKSIAPYNKNNPFSEYASFYYALSAYHQNYKPLAKNSLNEIKKLYPSWDKIDEVNFWIGKINIEDRDYFQGMKVLSKIQDKSLQPLIESLKTKSLSTITDVETLRMMREEYPKDPIVGKMLAGALAKNASGPADKSMLESLVKEFNLNKAEFILEAPKTFFKDVYSVSVMLPLMVNTLDPSPSTKRNQNVLDLYEGIKLAVDTLSKQGVKISLRAYDTERKTEKIKSILNMEELKSTDLLVGPFFQEECKPINEFSVSNKVNVFNPLHNNMELLNSNPYGFMFQPSLETMGKRAAEFLSGYPAKKTCMVFYGTSRRDSVLAANFLYTANEKGIKIISSNRLSREDSKNVLTILATPTEYDEFKYPKEFTLKKDSLGSIFVASDDALIYAKVISGIETRGDNVVVVGSEAWLDQHSIDVEKFQNLPIVLMAPNYIVIEKPISKAFARRYVKTHGRIPTSYASTGYELMLFLGNQLKKNGVYFQEAMSKAGVIPGYLTEGFNYQTGRSNEVVPFIKFENGNVKIVSKK
ncbi:MAG: hypothetical protein WKF87_18565 [Chryseolinea sp.]